MSKRQILWAKVAALLVAGLVVLTGTHQLFVAQPVTAQSFPIGGVWQQVYQQLPDLPKENQYVSKATGKVAPNNTLVSRLVRYHVYIKGRPPVYRLDWKLTLADYLDANEVIEESQYPGSDTLRANPIEGDRAAIKRLSRKQRAALVQTLVDIFNSNVSATEVPDIEAPSPSSQP